MSQAPELPRIDAHATRIAAPTQVVFDELWRTLSGSGTGPGAWYARLVGCRPLHAHDTSRPVADSTTIPGFAVTIVREPQLLQLAGRHHCSAYAITFELVREGANGRRGETTRLVATTHAAFPGPAGRIYRALVIGSRAHVLATRGMLALVRRRVEHRTDRS